MSHELPNSEQPSKRSAGKNVFAWVWFASLAIFIFLFLISDQILSWRTHVLTYVSGAHAEPGPGIRLVQLCDEKGECTSDSPAALYQEFEGRITEASVEDALSRFNKAGIPNVLYLNSGGGQTSALSALRGWMDRHPDASLIVGGSDFYDDPYWGKANVPQPTLCASTCAFWFAMGANRLVIGAQATSLMIHPTTFEWNVGIRRKQTDDERRVAAREIWKSLVDGRNSYEQEWRANLINEALEHSPSRGRWLDLHEAKSLQLTNGSCRIRAGALDCALDPPQTRRAG